jgi:hypothetical protein
MHNIQFGGLMLLALIGLSYMYAQPTDPKLVERTPDAEPRHDISTGRPDKSGSDYQPAALSGSGETPAYTSYQFQ